MRMPGHCVTMLMMSARFVVTMPSEMGVFFVMTMLILRGSQVLMLDDPRLITEIVSRSEEYRS
jgi:hypothetical protein